MLTREQSFFLTIIADFFNLRKTAEPEIIDWKIIQKYARQHQIEGIVYYQCKELIQGNLFEDRFASCLFSAVQRDQAIAELRAEFEKCNIPFIIMKGTEVSKCYPVPKLRTMGDTDVYVRREDKERADSALLHAGFTICSQNENEWVYYYNGLEFELHHSFLYDTSEVADKGMKEYSDKIWEYTVNEERFPAKIDWTHHLIFLILHLRKHFMGEGAGFRQFMDILAVAKNEEIDWEKIRTDAEKLDLLTFTQNCIAFCNRWFDSKIPFETELSEDFYFEATDAIFQNGVFGFDCEDNVINHTVNRVRNNGDTFIYRLKEFRMQVFPNYESMANAPQYSFVKGKPILLPLAWLYRIVYHIRKGEISKGTKLAAGAFMTKEIEKRDEYLNKWGLI